MKKFLFIDDEKNFLNTMARCLKRYPNVCFAECHNIEEALKAIEIHQPDVLFLDHSFGNQGNEGWQVVELLKDQIQQGQIKVFSTTGDTSDSLKKKYENYGVKMLNKPFDLGLLIEIINEKYC
ncbi:MAG: response regulator [Minisyncoccales bacterium]